MGKRFIHTLLLGIFLLGACQKPDNPTPEPTPTPTPTPTPAVKITIPTESQPIFTNGISLSSGEASQGGGAAQPQVSTVNFTAPASWTATISETKAVDWLKVEPSSGNAGSVSMKVTAQPNESYDTRSAVVTIKSGSATESFTVRQTGKDRPVEVSGITLDKNELSLTEGDSVTLTATVSPENASDKTVSWSSSNTNVATVDENGKVTAIAAGEATITAKAGDKSATCSVTVSAKETPPAVIPVASITLNLKRVTLHPGETETLVATIEPENASDQTITWTSSYPAAVTVDANGKITAVAVGASTIHASCGGKSTSCEVTVNPKEEPGPEPPATVAVSSVTLSNTTLTLTEGDSATLTATVNPENATDKTVTWSSSTPSVATVDANGKVTAVTAGTATITATAGDKSATCSVTVNKKVIAVTSVTLSKTELTLTEGDNMTLVATVSPENATDKTVTWSSSTPSVATVDANGKVTAVTAGTATITATAGDKSATCSVTVNKKVIAVTSVTLNKTELTLTEGDSETLTATVNPDNATDKTVTWSSSNTDIATVDTDGKVTAVRVGVATIKASAGGKEASCTVQVITRSGGNEGVGKEEW